MILRLNVHMEVDGTVRKPEAVALVITEALMKFLAREYPDDIEFSEEVTEKILDLAPGFSGARFISLEDVKEVLRKKDNKKG